MRFTSLKYSGIIILSIALLMVFDYSPIDATEQSEPTSKSVPPTSSKIALAYKLKVGWFTIGSGIVTIRWNAENFNGKDFHRVEVYAETLGLGNWLGSLDDTYISIIESESMKAIRSEKHVTVGKSRWNQWCTYDYDSMAVDVKVMDHRREDPNRNWRINLSDSSYGVLSTFMFLASRPWDKFAIGDSIMVKTFYEKKHYPIGIKYDGIEKLKFQGQDVQVYKLLLLLPEHKNVKKDRPINIYITADEHQYPIRIQTKLPILGKGRIELTTINGAEPTF